ncbi:MAG: 4-vinyl reductase [Anaerolineae bacterium]
MSDEKTELKTQAEQTEEKYYYPNKWGRVILTSAEDIMGAPGVRSLLNLAGLQEYIDNYPPDNMKKEFPFLHVSKLQEAMWEMYGKRGARVFATRAGEQSFKDGLAQFKSVAAAAQVAMKGGTLEAKAKIGLEFFSKFFNSVSDQKVAIGEDEKNWLWIIERCPMCWDRKAEEPVCYLAVGVLQGAFAWVADGKRFRISPVNCIGKGDEKGIIKIEKIPVE